MLRALLAAFLVLQATRAFADPTLVATGRLGVGNSSLVEEAVDGSRDGYGVTFGGELGIALGHIRPAIALDLGQASTQQGGDPVFGDFTMRERTVAVTARVHLDITDFFDVFAGIGATGLYEHNDTIRAHTWGEHHQLGLGAQLWQDGTQSVGVELVLNWAHFTPAQDEIGLFSYGVSLGYSVRFGRAGASRGGLAVGYASGRARTRSACRSGTR